MAINRVIIHWTAGGWTPNNDDKEHYHFMIDSDGHLFKGLYTPADNLICFDGKYAMHTGGGNAGSIGVAFCGMFGFKNPKNVGKYPLTRKQVEFGCYFIANLCKKYRIPVQPENIMTHYEFGKANPKTTSFGKIDIIYLPSFPNIPANKVGGLLRSKIAWYLKNKVT